MTTCLVLGGGNTLHSDIAAYTGPIDGVVACNDAGAEWAGDLDAWVSFHPDYWIKKDWLAERTRRKYPKAKALYAQKPAPGIPDPITVTDYRFDGQDRSGSSGLFSAKVALIDLGFDRVVLCGVPMTEVPHFFDDKPWRAQSVLDFRKAWIALDVQFRNRMKSMSGWTKTLLGAPDGFDG